jgi:hypothetical protein
MFSLVFRYKQTVAKWFFVECSKKINRWNHTAVSEYFLLSPARKNTLENTGNFHRVEYRICLTIRSEIISFIKMCN